MFTITIGLKLGEQFNNHNDQSILNMDNQHYKKFINNSNIDQYIIPYPNTIYT